MDALSFFLSQRGSAHGYHGGGRMWILLIGQVLNHLAQLEKGSISVIIITLNTTSIQEKGGEY